MLLLVFAHRHMGRLVEQHVRRLEHGIGVERDRGALAILARFVLELGHAVEPADPCRAVEQPGELAMRGHVALAEQGRFGRIDPGRDQSGGHFADPAAQACRFLVEADRVEIGEEEEAFALALILHPHPVADRAQIIAEVEVARRLDAGDDAHDARLSGSGARRSSGMKPWRGPISKGPERCSGPSTCGPNLSKAWSSFSSWSSSGSRRRATRWSSSGS